MAITIGSNHITIEDVTNVALNNEKIELSKDPAFQGRIKKGMEFLDSLLEEDGVIYGVTTGYGDSVTRGVPRELVPELPVHLTRFHGCGLGAYFDREAGRAIMATRLVSLCKGFSGVSPALLEQIEFYLNNDITSVIPEEGSVGASGDLTPLSYVAANLIGERDVYHKGEKISAAQALELHNRAPITLRPKEGLAMMNGTAAMTGVACLAYKRAEYLIELATRTTSLASIALKGNSFHFDEHLFKAKPHAGQQQIAAWIRGDLEHELKQKNSDRLQDRYSVRCAPHIIGVLADAMPLFRQTIENELNSANDNPLIDVDGERVLHGGHFYGGHIAFAMDSMKTLIANLADLLDRQMALLMDVKFNNGLPPNLSGAKEGRKQINHGFKATQIGVSAWTAEALKHTMPASVFSRSTECHNQDKVSMGTIAARDCMRILQLTEQVQAALLFATNQGIRLRIEQGDLDWDNLTPGVKKFVEDVSEHFELITEDRPLEHELRAMIRRIQTQQFELYTDRAVKTEAQPA